MRLLVSLLQQQTDHSAYLLLRVLRRLQSLASTSMTFRINSIAHSKLFCFSVIPVDTTVQIPTWSRESPYWHDTVGVPMRLLVHRDPQYFYPDPEEFNPDRWLVDPKDQNPDKFRHDTRAFMPFSYGAFLSRILID